MQAAEEGTPPAEAELSAMRVRSEAEFNMLKRIRQLDIVKEALPKQPSKNKQGQEPPQIQVKPICLLVAYMHGILTEAESENEGLKKDLDAILRAIPSFMDIML